jgi:hypothetical protein
VTANPAGPDSVFRDALEGLDLQQQGQFIDSVDAFLYGLDDANYTAALLREANRRLIRETGDPIAQAWLRLYIAAADRKLTRQQFDEIVAGWDDD